MYDAPRTSGRVFNSVNRTCERLDMGKTSVYELVKCGKLKKVKLNGQALITEESLPALLAEALAAAYEVA